MALSQVKITVAYRKFTVCSFVYIQSTTNLYNPAIIEPENDSNLLQDLVYQRLAPWLLLHIFHHLIL